MRENTRAALDHAAAICKGLPSLAKPFALAVLAVLSCMNKELEELKNGN